MKENTKFEILIFQISILKMGKTSHLLKLLREIFDSNIQFVSNVNKKQIGTITAVVNASQFNEIIQYFPKNIWNLIQYDGSKFIIKGRNINALYRYIRNCKTNKFFPEVGVIVNHFHVEIIINNLKSLLGYQFCNGVGNYRIETESITLFNEEYLNIRFRLSQLRNNEIKDFIPKECEIVMSDRHIIFRVLFSNISFVADFFNNNFPSHFRASSKDSLHRIFRHFGVSWCESHVNKVYRFLAVEQYRGMLECSHLSGLVKLHKLYRDTLVFDPDVVYNTLRYENNKNIVRWICYDFLRDKSFPDEMIHLIQKYF
jgi:hypothetical protein